MIVDNFSLSLFQACPALYELRIKQGFVPIRRRAALGFGGALHIGLAEWYRTGDAKKAIAAIVEKWPAGTPEEEWRTLQKATAVMAEYIQEYPMENFKIIGAPETPLVERAFTLDTGLYLDCQLCDGGIAQDGTQPICINCQAPREPLQYGGIIDAGILFSGRVYDLDHKTTTQLGGKKDGDSSYFFMQFKPNNQMTGYIWALDKLTNIPVGGAMINAIGLYKASETRFARQITTRAKSEIDEWLRWVLATANDIKRAERTGIWPWRTASCMLYGQCDFHNVHVLADPVSRQKRLEQDYAVDKWDHEARED
jgi:hypothetical protein